MTAIDQTKIGRASAPVFARAIRDALVAREGTATPVDVFPDPHTMKPVGAFVLSCAVGRFVITVAEAVNGA